MSDPHPEPSKVSCETLPSPPPSVVPTSGRRSRHRDHVVGSHSRSPSRARSQSSAHSRRSESHNILQDIRIENSSVLLPGEGDDGVPRAQGKRRSESLKRTREKPPENDTIFPDSNASPYLLLVRKMRRFSPVMVLENSGSVARDHLASERTFLAYVRTSLALSSAGVALVQLFTIADLTSRGSNTPLSSASRRVQRFARPLGVATIVLALITLVIGVYRYFLVQYALPEKRFPVARLSAIFISFVLGALVVVIFGALLDGVGS